MKRSILTEVLVQLFVVSLIAAEKSPCVNITILAGDVGRAAGTATKQRTEHAELSIDIAAIDRERILKAADTALKTEPITITAYRHGKAGRHVNRLCFLPAWLLANRNI